jgi:hypothetical protein
MAVVSGWYSQPVPEMNLLVIERQELYRLKKLNVLEDIEFERVVVGDGFEP